MQTSTSRNFQQKLHLISRFPVIGEELVIKKEPYPPTEQKKHRQSSILWPKTSPMHLHMKGWIWQHADPPALHPQLTQHPPIEGHRQPRSINRSDRHANPPAQIIDEKFHERILRIGVFLRKGRGFTSLDVSHGRPGPPCRPPRWKGWVCLGSARDR